MYKQLSILIIFLLSVNSHAQMLQWEQTSGLYALTVTSAASNGKGVVFAGTQEYGLYRSTNNGKTWEQPDSLQNTLGVRTVFSTPSGLFFINSKGVMRSSDNGESWTSVFLYAYAEQILPLSKDTLLLTARNRLFRSIDAGLTWDTVFSGISNNYPGGNRMTIDSNGHILAFIFFGGLYKSTDRGNNWNKWSTVDYVVNCQTLSDGTLISAAHSPASISLSTDFGLTWEKLPISFAKSLNAMQTTSKDEIFIVFDSNGIAKSTDKGNSWNIITEGFFNSQLLCFSVDFNDDIFFGGSSLSSPRGLGLIHSTNGGNSWFQIGPGIPLVHVYGLLAATNGYMFAGSYGQGIFRTSDNGNSWEQVNKGLRTGILSSFIQLKDSIYALTQNEGILKSGLDTIQWVGSKPGSYWISSIDLDSFGNLYYSYPSVGLYKYVDSTKSFIALRENVGSRKVLVTKSSTILMITSNNEVDRTIDDGNSWTTTLSGTVRDLIEFADGKIIAGTSDGIYSSVDDGQSWSLVPSSPPVATMIKNSTGALIVANNQDIFFSFDGATTFIKDNYLPISGESIKSLAIQDNKYIYAGSDQGVFRAQLKLNSVRQEQPPNKEFFNSFILELPSQKSSKLSIESLNGEMFSITVYNALGSLVTNQDIFGSFIFDTSSLPNGTYFIVLESNTSRYTEKFVVAY